MATTDCTTITLQESTPPPCTRCGPGKTFDDFYRKAGKLQQPCKACRSTTAKIRWATLTSEEREVELEKSRVRGKTRKPRTNTEARKAQIRANTAKWRLEHPEEDRKRMAELRAKYPEKFQAAITKYCENHRDLLAAKSAAYRAANPEKWAATKAATRKAHPETTLMYAKQRRAMIRHAAINDFTHAQWLEMQDHYDHRCAYCHKRFKGHLTQEHIIPLSLGGNHTRANIVPACRSCNSKKHDGPPLCPVQPLLLTVALPKPYIPRTKKKEMA
jgi:5-methylcytosine-specific restriction endonuclease McrA